MFGTLQYLTLIRPDIAYAVKFVCQIMQTPRAPHLIVVKSIFWYLKGTFNLGLQHTIAPLIVIHAFCDAD